TSGLLWALAHFPPLRYLSRMLIAAANLILPGKGLKEGPFTSEEEIRTLADVAAEEDVIEGEERRLIHSIFEFGDTVVREVMVPRPDMVGIEDDMSVEAAMEKAIEAGYSRLPVFHENHDNITGLVYLKDMVRAVGRGNGSPAALCDLIRTATFVPEQKRVAELLREMQTRKFHMAVVFDEHGGTAGLVTMEDLLEEIVGEIVDEYDVEVPRIERLGGGALVVAGRTSIDEVSEVLGVDLPDTEWDTVGGLIFNLLGRVPEVGETVTFEGIEFRAEEVKDRRIVTVHIEPPQTQPAPASSP
ncbi:MAG: hemolysin family protein, partial [Acidimicrobiia bacterium]